MKYAIICCSDSNYTIHSAHPTLQAAKIAFHQYSAALWNDPNTTKATVKLVDENLDAVQGYMEFIYHAEPESEE